MNRVFVDTAYWLAILRVEDALHVSARAWSAVVNPPLTTSYPVLLEVGDALYAPRHRGKAGAFIESTMQDDDVIVVPATEAYMAEAVRLYRARPDKSWSLTDFSFTTMQRMGLTAALTSDRHFIQAGLRALLLEEPSDQPS